MNAASTSPTRHLQHSLEYVITRSGIGDLIPILNRLEAYARLKDIHVVLYLGGFKNVLTAMMEIANVQPFIAEVISVTTRRWNGSVYYEEVWNDYSVMPTLLEQLQERHKGGVVHGFDVMDVLTKGKASFEDMPLQYPWTLSYGAHFNPPVISNIENSCGIHLATTTGSEDFDHGGRRFLSAGEWKKILDHAKKRHIPLVFFGGENDNLGIDIEAYGTSTLGKLSVLHTAYAIRQCKRFIGTNSWMWSYRSIGGLPTVCTYFTNKFWLRLQVPQDETAFYSHTKVFRHHDSDIADQIIREAFK